MQETIILLKCPQRSRFPSRLLTDIVLQELADRARFTYSLEMHNWTSDDWLTQLEGAVRLYLCHRG